jgi:hypothetical protein
MKGTLCHNGHQMQATFDAWYSLTAEGHSEPYGEADEPSSVYCADDCDNIPADIVEAATALFCGILDRAAP